jgi:hypothetical protein
MLTISELVALVASQLHLPERDIALYARRLREAGLLPTSKGRSFAALEPVHCARLVVAILASDQAANAPTEVSNYEELVTDLAEIIGDEGWAREIQFIRLRRHSGEVEVQDKSGRYKPAGWNQVDHDIGHGRPRLEITAAVSGELLRRIAAKFHS